MTKFEAMFLVSNYM